MTGGAVTYEALGERFSVEVQGDLGVDLDVVFADFERVRAVPRARFRIVVGEVESESELFIDDKRVAGGNARVLLQVVMNRIDALVIGAIDGPWLRAATVADERGAVVLAGERGSGKSTIAAHLC